MNWKLEQSKSRGRRGEDLACEWFRERGITVLARNLRKRWTGEVDLLIRYRGRLHLVEVKTGRREWSELALRVNEAKLKRMLKTLALCLEDFDCGAEGLQVDLFLVREHAGWHQVRWIQDVLPPELLLDPGLPDV